MNSYINLVLDAEAEKTRLRKVLQSAPEPEIARESIFLKQQNKTDIYAVPNNQSHSQQGLAIVHRIRN